jgi:hypothetical protein
MSNTNNITLDKIITKIPTKEYMDNYDAIFRKKVKEDPDESPLNWRWVNPPVAQPVVPSDKPVVSTEEWDEDRMDIIGQNGNTGY